MSLPRHSTIDANPALAALQNSENARDTLESFALRPAMRQITVERYTATGDIDTRIRIGAGARPWAVLLARCCEAAAEDSAILAVPIYNFVWDSTTDSLDVFEPYGLVANTVYKLQFLALEALP
jgi:hypothetical protein